MKALVFHARAYEFQGNGGEMVKGSEVSYMELMEPVNMTNEKGLPPLSVSAVDECLPAILGAQLPAVCEVDIARRPGRRGKPESVMVAFKAGKPWKLEDTLVAPIPTK